MLADEIGDLPGQPDPLPGPGTPGGDVPPLVDPPAQRRTTIVVAVRNEPGTLLAVLRVLAEHGLNMRKLESRPSRERAWEYVFWIDLDGDAAEPAMAAALEEVRGVTTMTRAARELPEPGRLAAHRSARSGLRAARSARGADATLAAPQRGHADPEG